MVVGINIHPDFWSGGRSRNQQQEYCDKKPFRTIRPRCIDLNFTDLSSWRNIMYGEKEEAGLCGPASQLLGRGKRNLAPRHQLTSRAKTGIVKSIRQAV